MPALSDQARAKVNLTLRVVSRRADGYHELESLVAFADCADRLSLQPGPDLTLTTEGPGARDCGDGVDNLVIKAARLLRERIPDLRCGAFTLDKRLPVAAGIGGGSADAAAALRLLARENQIAVDDPRLFEVARATGADVPVCLKSAGCLMTGIGETLMPVTLPRFSAVMVNPRVGVATKDVFAALGLRAGELRVGVTDLLKTAFWPRLDSPIAKWIDALAGGRNDLEAPALKVQPVIGEVLAALRAAKGTRLARMSGSGATCFAIFGNDDDAQAAAQTIRAAHPNWWVHAGTLS
jgi:4-diphosphocytidyl-2-C-methyl-D-erythritol kinase